MLISFIIGDIGGITFVFLEIYIILIIFHILRDLEEEVDILGINTMLDSGLDPNGMLDLFKNIHKEYKLFEDIFLKI